MSLKTPSGSLSSLSPALPLALVENDVLQLAYPPRSRPIDSRTSQTTRSGASTPPVALSEHGMEMQDPLAEQSPSQAFELAPVDRGRGAWTFVGCAFAIETLTVGFPSSFGVFQTYYLKTPPYSHSSEATINSIGTIALALQYISMVWVVGIYQSYPSWARTMNRGALVVCSLALFFAAFAPATWVLILTQGVMFGLGAAFLYAPVLINLSDWFVERRALAASIIFAGTAVGGTFWPFVIDALISGIGLRRALIVLASMVFGIGFVFLPGLKSRVPIVAISGPRARRSHATARRSANYDYRILRRPIFYVLCLTILMQSLGYYPVPFYLSTYAIDAGFSTTVGTLALSVFNLSNIVGQIAAGSLSNKLGYGFLMVLSSTGSALAAWLVWGFAHSVGVLFAFAVIFGSIAGAFTSTSVPASSDLAEQGVEEVSMIMSFIGISKSLALVGGPLISSALHTTSSSGKHAAASAWGGYGFTSVIIFVGGTLSATSVFGLVGMFLRARGH